MNELGEATRLNYVLNAVAQCSMDYSLLHRGYRDLEALPAVHRRRHHTRRARAPRVLPQGCTESREPMVEAVPVPRPSDAVSARRGRAAHAVPRGTLEVRR